MLDNISCLLYNLYEGVHNLTNKDLAELVEKTIKDNGINKTFISNKLGVSRQQINNILKKKNFSIDDANSILNVIGYNIESISIKKL